jgi:hypothetical protein
MINYVFNLSPPHCYAAKLIKRSNAYPLIHPFLGGDWRSWWLGGSRWALSMLTEGWIAPFVLICASLSTLGFEVAKLALENIPWCLANYLVGMVQEIVTWCNKNPAGCSGDSCLPYARSGICICHYWWIYARCLKLTKNQIVHFRHQKLHIQHK